MLKYIKKLGFILIGLMIEISLVFAQNRPPIVPDGVKVQLKIPTIPGDSKVPPETYIGGVFLPNLTKAILFGAGGIAVIFIIVAAVEILTAYGKDEKIDNAKKSIQYALVGLLICILAYAIVTIISSIKI